jgi:mannose-1-phosphate guanylyltransferase
MATQARPIGARAVELPSPVHLWGIVVSGSDETSLAPEPPAGTRRAVRTRLQRTGTYAVGRAGLFRRAIDRASRLVAPERVVAILSREHSVAYEAELRFAPVVHRVLQPRYRGTAVEVFLPVLQIARRDPHAVVAVLPGDQQIDLEARFMSYVARAAGAVSLRPDLPLVLGAPPGSRQVSAPWIEPGALIDGLEHLDVRAVTRFVRWATRVESQALFDGTGLVSTGVVVARAKTLVAVGRHYLPEVLETLEPLEDAFDAPEEPLLREALWECMPYASMTGEVLDRGCEFGVLPLPDVLWRESPSPDAELLAS